MNARESVRAFAVRSERWMLDEAFPFWADRTPSPDGGFYERLDSEGCGISGEPSRVRLQARMVFTFALAAELGWDRARALELVERGIATLTRDCRRADGLYGTLVRPGNGLIDDTAQAYDTAFALLAFSYAYRVFALDTAREAGHAVNRAIEDVLRYADGSGYRETLPAPPVRAQNPHMHLAEASLAWFDATDDGAARDRATAIADFVQGRFFDADADLLYEHAGDRAIEPHVEVGHLFEWVWILGRMNALTDRDDGQWMRALHAGGVRLVGRHGFLPLSQYIDGSVREAKQRMWTVTEKLKGHIAYHRIAPSDAGLTMIAATAQTLFADHIESALPGAWNDALGPDKVSIDDAITPATGYHVFLALQELMRFADDLGD